MAYLLMGNSSLAEAAEARDVVRPKRAMTRRMVVMGGWVVYFIKESILKIKIKCFDFTCTG